MDYNLAFIPEYFTAVSKSPLDPVSMSELFERGYKAAIAGYPWQKHPPASVRTRS